MQKMMSSNEPPTNAPHPIAIAPYFPTKPCEAFVGTSQQKYVTLPWLSLMIHPLPCTDGKERIVRNSPFHSELLKTSLHQPCTRAYATLQAHCNTHSAVRCTGHSISLSHRPDLIAHAPARDLGERAFQARPSVPTRKRSGRSGRQPLHEAHPRKPIHIGRRFTRGAASTPSSKCEDAS